MYTMPIIKARLFKAAEAEAVEAAQSVTSSSSSLSLMQMLNFAVVAKLRHIFNLT